MKIEVVGMSSSVTDQAYENVLAALRQLGIEAEVVRIEEMSEVVAKGIMMPPGVFVDGALKVSGKVPTVGEAAAWLK